MPLDIQAFRAAADLGSINLQNAGGDPQLVRGTIGTWFKSLFNIGDARQKNGQVLQQLREAIHNDPRYGKVDAQANALLGRLGTTLPLSGKTIRNILTTLDRDSVSANRAFAENLGTRRCNRQMLDLKLFMSCRETQFHLNQIPATVRNNLSRFLGERIVAMAGDHTVPLQEQAVDDLIEAKTADLAVMCKSIAESGLDDRDKRILQSQIFGANGMMKTPAEMTQWIGIRQNRRDNEGIQRQMSDVSNPQTPFRVQLGAALAQAGITEAPAQRTLEGLGKAVTKQLERMAHLDETRLTAAQGEQAVARVVADFIEGYQAAAALPNPQDAVYMKRAVLTSASPMSAAYVHELAAHAGDIAPNRIVNLGTMQSPADILHELNDFNTIMVAGFNTLPQNLKLEGNLGHQDFISHVTGLALSRAGLNQQQSQTLYQSLLGPAGQDLRQGLMFQSATSGEAASRLTVFTAIQSNVGIQAGIADAVFHQDMATPFIAEKENLPLATRAMLPGFQPLEIKNVPLARHPAGTEGQAKTTALDTMKDEFQRNFLKEMYRHIRKGTGISTDPPTFERDIVRQQEISLNGRRLPVLLNQLPLDVQEHIQAHFERGSREETQAIKDAITAEGYKGITQFLFGENAVFADLNPVQKNVVYGVAGMCCQTTIVPIFDAMTQMMTSEDAIPAQNMQHPIQKDISLWRTANGDIAFRLSAKDFINGIQTEQGFNRLSGESFREGLVTMTLPRAELNRMAQRDWQPIVAMNPTDFRNNVSQNEHLPQEQLFSFQAMDMITHANIESEQ